MYLLKAIQSVLIPALLLGEASAAAVTPLRQRDLDKLAVREVTSKPATYLKPMPFPQSRRRRSDQKAQDDWKLKMSETWTWTMDGMTMPLAKADCSFQDPASGKIPWDGRIVPLERLMDSIADVKCADGNIDLKFKDQQSYEAAESNWNWVNEKDGRYIAMVTNSPACGGQRQTYKVSKYTCDGDKSMRLQAKPVDFNEAFPVMDFKLSTQGVGSDTIPRGLGKRAAASIPVSNDFSNTEIFKLNITDNLDVALTCGDCKTTGEFDLDFEANQNVVGIFQGEAPFSAQITIVPKGVSATIGLGLSVSAQLVDEFDKSVTFLNIPLIENPLAVAGIADIGPSLMINMDAKLDAISAAVNLDLGSVTLTIPDNSKATLDFFNGKDDKTEGFQPTFSSNPPSANAGVSAHANFGPNIVLGLDATIFSKGVAAGLALAAPQLDLTASIGTDQDCAGIEIDADLSAQLNAFAGLGDVAKVAAENTFSLVGTSTRIFQTCLVDLAPATMVPAQPTDAAPQPTEAVPPPQPTAPFGGVVGSVFDDAGCQAAVNSLSAKAPALCGKDGGDAAFTSECPMVGNQCCGVDQACGAATLNGVTALCCT